MGESTDHPMSSALCRELSKAFRKYSGKESWNPENTLEEICRGDRRLLAELLLSLGHKFAPLGVGFDTLADDTITYAALEQRMRTIGIDIEESGDVIYGIQEHQAATGVKT